jgi:colanic acid biosynthesis protein WcaH
MEPPWIIDDLFRQVIQNAPLVSIDIIIVDQQGKVLLGMRTNEPAKGYSFVPGGVIRKNERIGRAFERILKSETGIDAHFSQAKFAGVFEHFYASNRYGESGYGTHYVVLAYKLDLPDGVDITADNQHSHFTWIEAGALSACDQVHSNSRAYANVLTDHIPATAPLSGQVHRD